MLVPAPALFLKVPALSTVSGAPPSPLKPPLFCRSTSPPASTSSTVPAPLVFTCPAPLRRIVPPDCTSTRRCSPPVPVTSSTPALASTVLPAPAWLPPDQL